MAYKFNPFTGTFDLTAPIPLPVGQGGTGLTAVASGSILAANSANTLTAITSTSGLKALTDNAGTVAWNGSTGTGNSVFDTTPTFVTNITAPTVLGGTGASGTLALQSTSNSTRGTVDLVDSARVVTGALALGATNGILIDLGVGGVNMTTGSVTGVRMAPTLTMKGNSSLTSAALFNCQVTLTDDGSARAVGPWLTFSNNVTFTAATAGDTMVDVAGIPAYIGLYHNLTLNRSGSGTVALTTAAGVYISNQANIGVGCTVTNYCGMLIDKPTVGGTLTNFYGIKNNGAAATNQWFLYETGGMQSSHKGRLRLGDNTAPTAVLDIQGTINTNQTTANGTVATAMSSLGPTGSHTTIQEWLTITINGTTRYIPCF